MRSLFLGTVLDIALWAWTLARSWDRLLLEAVNDIAAELDVVIGEFADFGLVHAHDLLLLGSTELEAGDEVQDEQDGAADDERVGHAADSVGELVRELDPMLVEPAAADLGEAVKMGYVVRGEETGQEITDETSNTVDGEDIERVIDMEEELEFGGIVASDSSDYTEDNSRPGRDEARTRGDCDQSRNDTTAETNSGPFPFKTVVEKTPGNTTDASRKVGDNCSHNSTKVGSESTTSVEAEPPVQLN